MHLVPEWAGQGAGSSVCVCAWASWWGSRVWAAAAGGRVCPGQLVG